MTLSVEYYIQGCYREPLEDIRLAEYAVDAGFEGVWVADHFHPWIDSRPYTHHPIVWLSALMATVPAVPVGTFVTCPSYRYHPPVLAQALATLDNMYPGRLTLGVGVGEAVNEVPFADGEWPDWHTRADTTVEALEVMRDLWEAEGFSSYHGEHFDYEDLKLYTNAREPIEVHWAATGPTSCDYAAEHAEHLIAGASTEAIREKVLPRFRSAAEEIDRDLSKVEVTAEFRANVGPVDELVDHARDRGEYVPFDTELDTPDPRAIQRAADERMAEMSDEAVREYHSITDDPAEIVAEFEALEEAGVTRVIVGSSLGDEERTIDAFERDVIPHFA